MNWFKRLWSNIWGDVIIRKSGGRPLWAIEQNGDPHHMRRPSDEEVDAFMEKMIDKVKKVPYMTGSGEGYNCRFDSTGDYSLRFNLADMTGSCENAKGMDL